MQTTPADKAALWILSVMVVGIGGNLGASWIGGQDPFGGGPTRTIAWLVATFVPLVLCTVMPGGFFNHGRYGPSRLGQTAAALLLAGYVGVSYFGSVAGWSLPWLLAAVIALWGVAILLARNTLAQRRETAVIASGAALLLFGVGTVLSGAAALRDGSALPGTKTLLGGVTLLLVGTASLCDGTMLAGVGYMLASTPMLLLAIMSLHEGKIPTGFVWLFVSSATLSAGAALLPHGAQRRRARKTLISTTAMLLGAAALLVSALTLQGGDILLGIALLPPSAMFFLLGVTLIRETTMPSDTTLMLARTLGLLLGTPDVLLGATNLHDGDTLTGAAFLLLGTAIMLGTAVAGRDLNQSTAAAPKRFASWLLARPAPAEDTKTDYLEDATMSPHDDDDESP